MEKSVFVRSYARDDTNSITAGFNTDDVRKKRPVPYWFIHCGSSSSMLLEQHLKLHLRRIQTHGQK